MLCDAAVDEPNSVVSAYAAAAITTTPIATGSTQGRTEPASARPRGHRRRGGLRHDGFRVPRARPARDLRRGVLGLVLPVS